VGNTSTLIDLILCSEKKLVSKLFYKLAKLAVGELAQNPELQARAAKIVKERVVPGAITGWEKAKPKLEQAKDAAVSATKDVAEVVRKNDPMEDPKKFLSEASRKFREKGKR
tara:strand:- start:1286 stop:1621 length:336 start_codon:yes stop_codon:yes gene_type:complete